MSDPSVLACAIETFRSQKGLAERAVAQLSDEQLHRAPGPDSNSVAVLVKHVAGNLRSRWTDFLTTDGEKPWRERDAEFVDEGASRETLMARWEEGWRTLFDTLRALTDADLSRTVLIRSEPHSVLQAVLRQVSHYGYHVGQIVYVARLLAAGSWRTLSIPRGGSAEYDRRMGHGPFPR